MNVLYRCIIGTVTALCISAQVSAGSPFSKVITCPVSGEEFRTTSSVSCSTMGYYLSKKPFTSCEFVTQIPVCPSNNLPVYKKFSDTEIEVLRTIIDTNEFNATSDISRFYSSYYIENNLSETNTETAFTLLLRGVWEDPQLLENLHYAKDFDHVFEYLANDETIEGKGFFYGAYAYTLMQRGKFRRAKRYIKKMAKVQGDKDRDYLDKYIKALKYCSKNFDEAALCGERATIKNTSFYAGK